MEKEHSYRSRSIQKKLMAATSMLLVATIMLVSSTYAWFTLSTAPEVTGITTKVGANGNLEIALADSTTWSNPDTLVTSGVGDSTAKDGQTIAGANITWGNLVDLSDKTYGLDEIYLLPASLNGDATKLSNVKAPLSIPVYGADGRVAELSSNTMFGSFDGETEKFIAEAVDKDKNPMYGVRALGTSSGMTDRQLSYRNARSELSDTMNDAKNQAKAALVENGNTLGDIIVNKALKGNNTVTKAQADALGKLLEGLETSLVSIKAAFNQAVLAQLASAQNQYKLDTDGTTKIPILSDADFAIVETIFDTENYSVLDGTADGSNKIDLTAKTFSYSATKAATEEGGAATTVTGSITISDSIINAIKMYNVSKASLETALTKYKALDANAASYDWTTISPVITPLVNTEGVSINGAKAEDLQSGTTNEEGTGTKDVAMQTVIDAVLAGQGVNVQMLSGTGLFANIADICGAYSASITITEVSFGGITAKNLKVTMSTVLSDANITDVGDTKADQKAYLVKEASRIDALGAPEADTSDSSEVTLTDTYGYMLDFYFRTNAADSDLLLQTEPVDRVYSNKTEENSATQGAGSYMKFTSKYMNEYSNEEDYSYYPVDSMKSLMSAIRVVFVDPAEGTIFAEARLDMENAEVETKKITVKETASAESTITTEVNGASTETTVTTEVEQDVEKDVPTGITAYLKVVDRIEKTEVPVDEEDETAGKKTVESVIFKDFETATITGLTQNTAKKVSVIVYLDGDYVTNVDVGSSADFMNGILNLQFASSAELVPMENSDLRDMVIEESTENTAESTTENNNG